MFEGFAPATSDFIWELCFHNEREWFREHKEQYETLWGTPIRELAKETTLALEQHAPDIPWAMHLSRIYRDARRLYGRGPFKDHMWFTLKDSRMGGDGPTFWFEMNASSFRYGFDFYNATGAMMEEFRRRIAVDPARFERLAQSVEDHGIFQVYTEQYKRPKAQAEGLCGRWVNLKFVGAERKEDFGGDLFSPELPQILADAFASVMDLFRYFSEIYTMNGGTFL